MKIPKEIPLQGGVEILKLEDYLGNLGVREQVEGEGGLLRTEWPKIFQSPEYAGWMSTPDERPVRFVYIRWGEVLSHAAVMSRKINFENSELNMAGLGGVITRPAVRNRGLGSEVTSKATQWILDGKENRKNFDFAALTCDPAHEHYYEKFGWLEVNMQRRIYFGLDINNGHNHSSTVMAISITDLGQEVLNKRRGNLFLGKPW